MGEKLENPDEWWEGLAPKERMFFRNVMRYADDLLDGEVVRMSYNGKEFVLKCDRLPAIQPRLPCGRMGKAVADDWWAGVCKGKRAFIQDLGSMLQKVARHRDECLEIAHTGDTIAVTLMMTLERPIDVEWPERN
jgi:hypothetical protein